VDYALVDAVAMQQFPQPVEDNLRHGRRGPRLPGAAVVQPALLDAAVVKVKPKVVPCWDKR